MRGALLQIGLVLGFGCSVMVLQPGHVGRAVATAAGVWLVIVVLWKFALALVPDDISELALKHMIPFSHFFYTSSGPCSSRCGACSRGSTSRNRKRPTRRRSRTKKCRRSSTSAKKRASSSRAKER